MEVVLERLYPEQPVEDVAALVGRQGLRVRARLDRLAQPQPLAVAGEMLDLVRDRPGVGLAQARERIGERLAGNEEVEGGGRNALERVVGEAVVGGVEGGIADRIASEGIQARGHVAVRSVGVNKRSGRPDLFRRSEAVTSGIGVEAVLAQRGRAVAAPSAASGRHGESEEDSGGVMTPIVV